MESFTPVTALIGGILIGVSMVLLFWFNGKIAGISGLVGGVLSRKTEDKSWRILFLAGLILSGFLYQIVEPDVYPGMPVRSSIILIVGGFLVGFGTRMGNGCTSGHGLFGLARLSPRSFVATFVFMTFAILTVYLVRHVYGGVL